MPKTIPNKEVTRRCLRRIQRWSVIPSFAEAERDWTFFASAFPEVTITQPEVMRALEALQVSGHITLSYPRPRFEPDTFTIALHQLEVV
jgi:hypothetical protein